jgi:DMSO/TMAO reductase YedYZ molybdopterin-dependent catalytic subunit
MAKMKPPTAGDRRRFIHILGALSAGAALGNPAMRAFAATSQRIALPFENGERELLAFPQKRPLIVQTMRPPQLETPFSVFNEGLLTPNDAFFVRYHWSGIPTSIDPTTYQIRIDGKVKTPLTLTLQELKRLADPVDLVAVNQCSGNSRGFFVPRTNGGQLGHGAIGNARWTGVPLKKVLEKAGIQASAVQVSFDGLDQPPLGDGPDFGKALDIDHALNGEVMLAWGMNGEDLPMLNGFPIRLIVPGYFGTYWVKHVSEIHVLDNAYDGYWMKTGYRIPDNDCECVPPGTQTDQLRPVGQLKVRSFLTSLVQGASLPIDREVVLRGIAFDHGQGIKNVSISVDGGQHWRETKLGENLGKFSFREWTAAFKPTRKGPLDIKVRAESLSGEVQPLQASWNPAGYKRNVVETTRVTVV